MGISIYLDWRPVAVDAITSTLSPISKLNLDNKRDCDEIREIQERYFPGKYYFPVYLRENFKSIRYVTRADGIFSFSFVKRGSSKAAEFELAQFLSYFIKSVLGHTHDNDQSPFDISHAVKQQKITFRRITNSPVKVAQYDEKIWSFCIESSKLKTYKSLDGALKHALSQEGLLSNLTIGIDGKPTQDLAVLRIKKNFAAMFDLTELATQGMTARRQRITLVCIFLGIYSSILIANSVGFLSQDNSPSSNFFYGHPLSVLIVFPFLYTLLRQIVYRPLIKPHVNSFVDDFSSKQSLTESKYLILHKFYPFIFRFVYNKNFANNLIIAVFLTLSLFVFFKELWDFIITPMGIPLYQADNNMWNIDPQYYGSTHGVRVLCFLMILISCMNFIPKLWKYRYPKFKAWKICLGYLYFGNIYCQILENIFYPTRRRRAVGFQHSVQISALKLQSERFKYITDCAIFGLLIVGPFVTTVLYSR